MDHQEFKEAIYGDEAVVAAEGRLKELMAKESTIKAQIESASNRRNSGELVEAVLAGADPVESAAVDVSIEQLHTARRAVTEAIGRVRHDVETAKGKACDQLCAELKPTAEKQAKKTLAALKALQHAATEEREFYEALRKAGVGYNRPDHWVVPKWLDDGLRGPMKDVVQWYAQHWGL